MNRPRLLDLFCKAGGAAMGYHRAGFDVYGIDIEPQPNYPFTLLQMDAIYALGALNSGFHLTFNNGEALYLKDFASFHASPPCQAYTRAISPIVGHRKEHPDLLQVTREALIKTGKPCVIENVPGSPMKNYIKLDGTMFGLKTKKERQFELYGFEILMLPAKLLNTRGMLKNGELVGIVGHTKYEKEVYPNRQNLAAAYGIDWKMNRSELRSAIPPAYTEFIGKYLLSVLPLGKTVEEK